MRILAIAFISTALLAEESVSPVISPILPATPAVAAPRDQFQWSNALNESMRFLFVEHGVRLLLQKRTRARLGGPFLGDWSASVKSVGGWGDGDPWVVNYVFHPLQGAASGYIQVQNDPQARRLEFSATPEYWRSRLKALAWNAAYSTQFEIGPISESSIGNVGQRKGTSGYVDFVLTPAGGFAVMIAEDWLDRRFIQRLEAGTTSAAKRAMYRLALNPCRSFANVLRGKWPWRPDWR
jgi:hypothetical protein